MEGLKITRLGCLAVHLMPKYQGRKLEAAVKRIAAKGPADEYEREAVVKANGESVSGPKFKTSTAKK